MVIPILESKTALDNLDDILSVDGIDTVVFGPGDLSADMQVAIDGPEIRAAHEHVLKRARARNVLVFTAFAGDPPVEPDGLIYAMELMILRRELERLIKQ